MTMQHYFTTISNKFKDYKEQKIHSDNSLKVLNSEKCLLFPVYKRCKVENNAAMYYTAFYKSLMF